MVWYRKCLQANLDNVLLGCPSIVRSDYGTENFVLAACHMALHHNHEDEFSGERSFWFGLSTTNTVESRICKAFYIIFIIYPSKLLQLFYFSQRIESWWAQLRNSVTDWWINIFKVSNILTATVLVIAIGIIAMNCSLLQDFVQEGIFNPHIELHKWDTVIICVYKDFVSVYFVNFKVVNFMTGGTMYRERMSSKSQYGWVDKKLCTLS